MANAVPPLDPRLVHLREVYANKPQDTLFNKKTIFLLTLAVASAAIAIFATQIISFLGLAAFLLTSIKTISMVSNDRESENSKRVREILATPGYFEWAVATDQGNLSSSERIINSFQNEFANVVRPAARV